MPKGDRLKLKADPEDGTTPVANLLLEAVAMAKISGLQKGAILYLWRRTYGWIEDGKRVKERKIPIPEWINALDSEKSRISKTLSELDDMKIIHRRMTDEWGGYYYSINTDVKTWNHNCLNIAKLSEMITVGTFATVGENATIEDTPTVATLDNATVGENATQQLAKTQLPTLYKENINKLKESSDVVENPIETIITIGKKSKTDPPEWLVWRKSLFLQLGQRRNFQLTKGQRAGEAKTMGELFQMGYNPDQIMIAFDKLSQDDFWKKSNTPLTLMSVAKSIGKVLQNGNGQKQQGQTKYSGMIQK